MSALLLNTDMSVTQEHVVVEKKKRGRKKKSDVITEQPVDDTTQEASEKPKSRRGRKTKSVVTAYDVESNNPTMSDDENIIVKLDVRGQEMQDITQIQPGAYDAQNSFESTPLNLFIKSGIFKESNGSNLDVETPSVIDNMQDSDDTNLMIPPSTHPDVNHKVVDLLMDFQKKSNSSEWPQSTSIACYWCCHPFATVPFGIPVKYYNQKFHVYGCFCSLECATAFNFDSRESSDEVWERYNLINLLSRKLDYRPLVKPAPSKLALKMFGGHLDIEGYRQFFLSNKILCENFPPMMTLTQQIEEINECDINSEYRYIPIDHERINKFKEKLTLRRSKPLTNYKHTLDHMMNLKIN